MLSAFALMAVVGCQSSPTEPSSSSTTVTPKPPAPTIAYSVSVTADPGDITLGGTGSSNITVQVRRADTGQAPADGTTVRLTTTLGGFGSAGGPQQIDVQLVGGQAQAVLFASEEAGTAAVRATIGGSSGAANVRIGQPATFFVSSVSPNLGTPEGGQQVTILGGGFDEPVRVTFNGAAATVRSVTSNRIVVVTPSAGAAGVDVGVGETESVSVGVTINVNEPNQITDTLERGFTYALGGGGVAQPQIFTVSPQSGSNEGGTTVTISGSGFQSPVQVTFGIGTSLDNFVGVEAEVLSVTPNQIVVETPAARGFGQNLTNQLVSILIRNNNGFSTVGTGRFKYGTNVLITAMGPGSGSYLGGTLVTIQGSGFDEPVAVSFNFEDPDVSVAQSVRSVTGSQIVVLTGPAPLPDECPANGLIEVEGVRVVNIETGDFDEADIGFNFVIPLPQVFGVSPSSGSPDTNVTLSGQNFAPNVQVIFGDPEDGSSGQILGQSSSSLSVRVPNAPQGFTFIQEPCDGNGDGNPGGTRNAPTPITVTVRNLDGTGCLSTLSNAFVLTPPNTTCNGDTTTAPPPPTVQCNDTFDNDSDGLIDAADPQCTGPTDNSEST